MTISSLEVVADDGLPFSIDAGWGEIMQLEGSVRVHLSKHLKDPKINVEFFGESETLWSGERIRDPSDKKPSSFGPRRLIKRTIYVSPSPLMMPSNVNRFLLLPFSISLPEVGLPPTFSDFRGSITYGIRATISYVEGMRIIRTNKTVEVPVIVAMPIVVRKSLVVNQNHLLYQEPYNPEKVMYTLSVPRRAVCIGESVDLQIQVLNMPPGRSVSSVMVALNTMFEFRGKASVPVSLPPLSKVFDDSWELDHREMMTSNKLPNWKRSYSLLANIEKAKPTLDSPLISVKHFLRLEIRLVGQMYPNVSVEIPIVLVPPWEEPRKLSLAPIDDAAGKEQANASADTSLGPGPRQALTSDSANAAQGTSTETLPSPVAKIDAIPLNGGKSLQIIMPNQSLVCTDYDPLMPDELELRVGDIIVLNMVHDDGWAHGTNLTTNESGMLPLAVLNRDETIPLPSSSAPMAATAQDDAQSDAFSFTHTVIELVGPPKPPQQNRFHKYMEKSNGQGIISPSSQAPVSTSSPSVGLPTDPISGIKSYFGPVTASPSMRTINGRAAPAPFSDDDDLSVVGGNGGRPPVSSNLSYQPSITPNPEVVNGRFGSVSVDPRNNLNAGSAPHPSWTQSPTVDPIVPTYAEPSIAAPKPQSSAAPPSSLVQPPYASPISSQSPIFRSITPPGPNSQRVSPISQIPGAQSSFNPPMYATSHNYQHSPTRIEPFEAIRTGLPSSAAQQHAPAASSPLSRSNMEHSSWTASPPVASSANSPKFAIAGSPTPGATSPHVARTGSPQRQIITKDGITTRLEDIPIPNYTPPPMFVHPVRMDSLTLARKNAGNASPGVTTPQQRSGSSPVPNTGDQQPWKGHERGDNSKSTVPTQGWDGEPGSVSTFDADGMAESIYRIDPEPRAPKLDLDLRTTPSSAITSRIMDAPVSKRTVAVEKQKMSTPPSRALDEVTMVPLKPPAEEVVSPSNTEHVTSDDDDLDPYADYLDYWLAGTVSAPSEDSETLSRFSRPVSVVSSTPSRRSIVAPRPPSSVHPARRAPSSASTRSQRLSIQSGTTSIPARRSSNGATLISSFNLIYGHALNDGTNSTSSSPISEPMYAETMRSQRIHAWAVMAASSSSSSPSQPPRQTQSRVRYPQSTSSSFSSSLNRRHINAAASIISTASDSIDVPPEDIVVPHIPTPVLPPMDFGVGSLGIDLDDALLKEGEFEKLLTGWMGHGEGGREVWERIEELDGRFAAGEVSGEEYLCARDALIAGMGSASNGGGGLLDEKTLKKGEKVI